MISTDRKIFEEWSDVRARQAEYAKDWGEVHIIVFNKRSKEKGERSKKNEVVIAPNCWAYSTGSRFKLLYPFDAMRLGRFIMEKRGITDITCQDASLTAMAGVSLKKSAARRAAGKASSGVSLEIQVHEDIGSPNYSFNITNKIRKFLALNYLPKADHIRVVSDRIKEFLIDRLNPPVGGEDSKIEVRPIVVDTESIRSAQIIVGADLHKKYPQFDKIVLMAGRLESEKNVRLAIEAWPLVIEKHPKAGLIIIGNGSLKNRLERQAKNICGSNGGPPAGGEPQAPKSIVFEGWTDKPTLYSYYKTADLFLNTSLFEGYGMALVEAQAAGCRIVSTDVGVAGEIAAIITDRKAESGVLIVDWNKQSVADGIVKVLITRS